MGLRALIAGGLALTLVGCVTVEGALVFVPHDPGFVAGGEDELQVAGETLYDPDTEFRTEDGTLVPNLPAADVTHGYRPYGEAGDHLAWTHISRPAEPGAPPRPLIVHCGGNGTSRYKGAVIYSRKMIDHGDVLLFDYPGTGDSTGEANFANYEAAAGNMAAFAQDLAEEGRPLIFWGHSLGGFVCARMAGSVPETDGMIFEASARNFKQAIGAWMPWYLFMVQVGVDPVIAGYDNVDLLDGFDRPVLVLAGENDERLPVGLSRKLYKGLKRAGRDVTLSVFEAGHSSIPWADGFGEVIDLYFSQF